MIAGRGVGVQFNVNVNSEQKALSRQVRGCLPLAWLVDIKKERPATYADKSLRVRNTRQYGVEIGLLKHARTKDDFRLPAGSCKIMRAFALKPMRDK